MPGDSANASIWPDADVYVGPITAPNPADVDTAFGGEWGLVGLLDGAAGFTEQRNWDRKDLHAWGGELVRVARNKFKMTRKFTALEDNDTTRDLIWPGSSPGSLVIPRPSPVKVAFETREGDFVRRLITAKYAEIDIDGDIKDTEEDLTKYELIAHIFADTSVSPAELWVEQKTELGS